MLAIVVAMFLSVHVLFAENKLNQILYEYNKKLCAYVLDHVHWLENERAR